MDPLTAPRRVRRPAGRVGATLVALALTAPFAGGCALFLKRPTVRIAEVEIGSIGLLGATAQVRLDVSNPNGFDLTAEEVRYRLSFADGDAEGGWRTLTEGRSEEEQRITAGDTSQVRLSLPFRYEDVGRAMASLMSQGELRYRLEGDVRFDVPGPNLRVPFDRQGTIVP